MALAFLAATLSALSFAALDALRKALARRLGPVPLVALLALGQLPLFLAWAALAGATRLATGYAAPASATIVLNVVANLLFIRAVHLSPLSLTIPFLSFTPVFSALISLALLGERPALAGWIGIGLVVAGALVVNLRWQAGVASLAHEPGSLMMGGVALLWSLAAVFDKRALAFADVPVHAAVQCAGVGLVLLALLVARGRLAELREAGPLKGTLLLALAAAGVGLAFQFLALRLTLVGFVEALKRSIGMLLAVVVGRLAFAEPITPGKLAGVGLMSAGVALIVW